MLWLLLLENDFQSTLRGIDKLPVLYMMGSGTAIELRTVLLFFLTRVFSPPLSLSFSLLLSPPPPNWNLETRETVAVSVNCCLSLLNFSMTSYRFRERFISSLHTRFKLIKFSPYNANESKDKACVKFDCVKEWLSSHQSRTIILFDTRG